MSELTEPEQLEKRVADTLAALSAYDAIYYNYAAYAAWVKAKKKLKEYLKEQDNG